MRARETVRAKSAQVNSVFLVQLRKMAVVGLCESSRMKNSVRERSEWPYRESFCANFARDREFLTAGFRIVHRACTGNAEREFLNLIEKRSPRGQSEALPEVCRQNENRFTGITRAEGTLFRSKIPVEISSIFRS